MELDVTHFVENEEPREYSNSVFDSGREDIGIITWTNAMEYAEDWPFCTDEESLEEIREWLKGFGAWDTEELDELTCTELNAMVVQSVASDLNASENYESWEEYSEIEGGRLLPADDKWHYYIGD